MYIQGVSTRKVKDEQLEKLPIGRSRHGVGIPPLHPVREAGVTAEVLFARFRCEK